MHSHETDETPASTCGEMIAARRRSESFGLAVIVLAACVTLGAVTFSSFSPSLPAPTDRDALMLALGAAAVSSVGMYLLERHRRMSAGELGRLRDANRALRQAGVKKDEFLANVSHELRTPLNVVLGYVDLLLDHSFGPLEPAQRDILHRITKNASNLSHLVNDLLDLSRIEAGRMHVEMEVVELAPLFADLTAVMEVLLAGHEVTFDADIAPDCHRLRADPDRLKQIVSNLLVNAVKFTERGSIDLHAESDLQGRIVVSVADTGIGIPRSDQQAIFQPFRQAHDRLHRAPGAGIGLSISSRLAMLMGGTLTVESEPGEGSRFTLTLDGVPAEEPPGPFPILQVS